MTYLFWFWLVFFRTDELLTPKNECLSSAQNFGPISSEAATDVTCGPFAPFVSSEPVAGQQLGNYLASLGLHGVRFVEKLWLHSFFASAMYRSKTRMVC